MHIYGKSSFGQINEPAKENSYEMRKAQRASVAMKHMFGYGKNTSRDTYTHSENSPYLTYTAVEPVAIIDNFMFSPLQFRTYLDNFDNPSALLDIINFSPYHESAFGANWEYGVLCFGENTSTKQVIPNYAIPRMNPENYSPLRATNNTLSLSDRSYRTLYSSSGDSYVMTINNKKISYAPTESAYDFGAKRINTKNSPGAKEREYTRKILNALIRGRHIDGYLKPEVQKVLSNLGFNPGKIRICVGDETNMYYLSPEWEISHISK